MMAYQILVTGSCFTGHEFRSIEPVIEEILSSAQEEVLVVAYVITESAIELLQQLEQLAQRGVRVIFVLNNPGSFPQTVQVTLMRLLEKFAHVEVRAFSEETGQLHAKVIVVDRQKAVIGSANLSWGGLIANHEVGVLVEGEPVWKLAGTIDALAGRLQRWLCQ
jgi:phosphatidylserine/phosphatidylglycerophosphate/cardiolipin synthase-like enzyme